MLDFYYISVQYTKNGVVLEPKFTLDPPSDDLMIKGGDFFAVWDEEHQMWSKNENRVIRQVDESLKAKKKEFGDANVLVKYMKNADSGVIDKWHKFVKQQLRDRFHLLDQQIVFSNTDVKKEDYASHKLSYPLMKGDYSAYDELIGTLYDEDNRRKLEWSIGAIISGDSKRIQKFIVIYGSAGSGKSTILNIIEKLFGGDGDTPQDQRYWSAFNAKDLGASNAAFALESFKSFPLVSIQHDGNLSKIEDNTRLNSLVSHETMEVNAKFEKLYSSKFNTFLYVGTNTPVKITEAKSGIIRRLIDVRPSGKKVSPNRYKKLVKQIDFELGAIAWHCLEVYKSLGENYYDSYVPIEMISATNDFFNFVSYYYEDFASADQVTLNEAWAKYDEWCTFTGTIKQKQQSFRTELLNYFREYKERAYINGVRVRSLYSSFIKEKFETGKEKETNEGNDEGYKESGENNSLLCGSGDGLSDEHVRNKSGEERSWLELTEQPSLFDTEFSEWPAQYEKDYGKGGQPEKAWVNCETYLKDLDTTLTHYAKPPGDIPIIMADFDLRGEDGEKDLQRNLEAAAAWPKTYAELSKSGGGVHLYYLYFGDLDKISSVYAPGIEIKVFKGGSAIRRKLTKCNNIPIATFTGVLPLKGEKKKKVDWEGYKNAKHLHEHLVREIKKNLNKEVHADTTSSIDMIKKILDDAHESGIPYDVSDLRQPVFLFACNSTNQKDRCIKTVSEMQWKSEEIDDPKVNPSQSGKPIVIDIEIYPPDEEKGMEGLFLICWKYYGAPDDSIVAMVNPKAYEVEALFQYMMIGYNILEYDAPLLYGAAMGWTNRKLYDTSDAMINKDLQPPNKYQAKKMVLYDVYEYCKAAGDGKSLKKWEIELGISHMEMGIPWDQAVPKEMWPQIIEYCKNDVIATERVYDHTKGYRMAKDFQVNLVKALHGDSIRVSTSDTANTLTKRAIFGANTKPQNEFNYRDLARPVGSKMYDSYREKFGPDYKFRVWNDKGLPEGRDYIPGEILPDRWSILPFFPGYVFDKYAKKGFQSCFHEDYGGEGGRTLSKPGVYVDVWDGDIASQYPHSIMAEMLFGPKYTKIFAEIVKARIAVKHKDYETASKLVGGALKPFLSDETAKDLAQGMKIIINAVYGLTKARFENEFRDPRNVDNIVAKRGNLFMLVLKEQIEARGYSVVHIKTDSIKIANATEEIKNFVVEFGREYGYEFETEGEFLRFALVNDAAYVAYDRKEGWITKAAQFQEPYVRKTLFTKEEIQFDDLCQTFNVHAGSLYLDRNEKLECVDDELETAQKDYQRHCRKFEKHLKKIYPEISDNWITSFLWCEDRAFDYLHDNPESQTELYLWQTRKLIDKVNDLKERQPKGHNMQFVGRVGRFCPVVEGADGGILYRVQDGKNYAVGGSSGYRWLEAEYIQKYGMESQVDYSYYRNLVDDAKEAITKLLNGTDMDLEWFVSEPNEEDDFLNIPEEENREVVIKETKDADS